MDGQVFETLRQGRIGHDEERTSSGRAELGGYTAILKRTPDTQDFLTATDSEVLCRLVRRWIGQGGKASLANTADANILDFIIGKLRARITTNARRFLVKIKTHRGDPLNERGDDLVCVIYCHLSKLSVGQTPRLCSLPSKSLLIILMFLLRVVVIW